MILQMVPKQAMAILAVSAIWLFLHQPAAAQQGGSAYYFYDANGRLTSVLSPTGEAAIYNYDPAGNFTSITRLAATTLSILDFTPGTGSVGTTVTIYGTGFSATPSANTVKFNGVTASVSAATNIRLDVQVPSGATSGPIGITSANGAINSSGNFFVTGNVEFSRQISYGESVPFTFNNTYPSPLVNEGLLTFDGTAGQRVSLVVQDLLSCLLSLGQPPFKYADISILSPAGVSLVSVPFQNYWFGSANPQFDPPTTQFAWIETLSLPASGRYTIRIDPNNNNVMPPGPCWGGGPSYGFGATARLYDVSPDLTGNLSPDGTPFPVNFSSPGQNAKPTFAGAAGLRISLRALQSASTAIVSNLTIINPDNTNLTTSTVSSDRFIEPLILPANGTYTVLLDPQYNKTRATTLYLYNMPPDISGSIVIGGAIVSVNIGTPGQIANLAFNVPIAQTITFTVPGTFPPSNTISDPLTAPGTLTNVVISILNSSGTTVYSSNFAVGTGTLSVPSLQAGNYTLRIDPSGPGVGKMDVRLSNP